MRFGERFDFKDLTPCGAELDFDELMALQSGPIKIRPIPRFPAIERDLSILVAEQTAWAQIAQAVESVAPDELEEIRFVDIYRGKGITPGKKSVTLSLRFRDDDGTLTHETRRRVSGRDPREPQQRGGRRAAHAVEGRDALAQSRVTCP